MRKYLTIEAVKNALRAQSRRFTCADETNGCGSVRWSANIIYAEDADNAIDALPAADVADVVRCKDCKWWRKCLSDDGTVEYANYSRCEKGHRGYPAFFCADGERKDSDE